MTCFKFPRGLCQHITLFIQNFWWGSKKGERKMVGVSWDSMTMPKHMGGVGFRNMEISNICLLAKQAWRLLQEPSSLSARILKVWYYLDESVLNAELGKLHHKLWEIYVKVGMCFVEYYSGRLGPEHLPESCRITRYLVILFSGMCPCDHRATSPRN